MSTTRLHRLLAIYCSLQAWQRGLDGIHIDRGPLCHFLEISSLRFDRVNSIADDFKPWFPYHGHTMESQYGDWENTISFSRVPFDDTALTPFTQLVGGGKIEYLKIPKDGLTERTVWSSLWVMLHGFAEPQEDLGFRSFVRSASVL